MRRGNRQVWWMLNRRHRTPFRQRLLRIPVKRGGTTTRRRTSAFSRATRERPLRSFSPLLFLHFFFVIIQPSSPFFHPSSPFFCIFHDARRRLYRNPFTSSPSVRVIPGFKLAVQSSDTSRWRARRRRQPPTNIPRLEWLFRGVTRRQQRGWIVAKAPANCRFSDEFWWIIRAWYEFIAAASLYYQSSPSWTVTAISAEIKVFHLRPISITLRGIPIRPPRSLRQLS